MERRLLKDFQIGLVEGLVQDAITASEKGPKDVFSKIAKAIGRKTSQGGSKKKDWNAVARQKSVARDPIGSTAEGAERRHRQSVRRYILDHQKDSLMSMDADKLVEYNPRLADMAPAARVAYAKFKIPKIKQEYDAANVQVGADDVFENAPTVDVVDETKKGSGGGGGGAAATTAGGVAGSIVRPRPKSARGKAPVAGALPYPSASASTAADADKPEAPARANTASKTTAGQQTAPKPAVGGKPAAPEPAKPTGPEPPKPSAAAAVIKDPERPKPEPRKTQDPPPPPAGKDAAGPSQQPSSSKSKSEEEKGGAKGQTDADKGAGGSEKKDADPPKGGEDKAKEGGDKAKESGEKAKDGGDKDKKDDRLSKPESPKRGAGPKKQGGKSKVTGEILTGWL